MNQDSPLATPAVSVVIATHNRCQLVPRAVRSALASTGPDDEIVVADDGSTDGTEQVLAEFGNRIRYVRFPHGGCGATRNRGVQLATRPLVAILDSDDEWDIDKLPLQRAFMARRPDVLFCFSDFRVRRGADAFPSYLVKWHRDSRSWDEILAPGQLYSGIAPLPAGRADFRVHVGNMFLREMESDYVATSTVMIRRQEAGEALRFPDDLKVAADKECYARLARVGDGAFFDCDTATQWGHDGPRMTDSSTYTYASARLTILERVWGSDPAFVSQHGDRLKHACQAQRLKRARWLLARGRTSEARAELREAGRCPLSFRMLAALPGPVATGLLKLRRLVSGQSVVAPSS